MTDLPPTDRQTDGHRAADSAEGSYTSNEIRVRDKMKHKIRLVIIFKLLFVKRELQSLSLSSSRAPPSNNNLPSEAETEF